VLEGELFDDRGEQFLPGTLILQRPGSVHRVASVEGCKVLVVRQKGAVSLH
jgi:acetyl-CoA synthetase